MQLTREWAALRGFDYHFLDDRFFDLVPPWYRNKVKGNILVTSDLARLLVAKGLLRRVAIAIRAILGPTPTC